VLQDPDAGAPEPPGSTDPESEIEGDKDERRREMMRCGCERRLETGRGGYERETGRGRGSSTAGGTTGCACADVPLREPGQDWPSVRVRARGRGGGGGLI
jgi:hypothetical protein